MPQSLGYLHDLLGSCASLLYQAHCQYCTLVYHIIQSNQSLYSNVVCFFFGGGGGVLAP